MIYWLPVALALVACSAPSLPPVRVGGQLVAYEHGAHLPGHAGARWEPRGPVIYITDRFEELPETVQWWTLAHELCHLERLGRGEIDADCCALRWTVASLGYSPTELSQIAVEVQGWPSSPVHPGGAERVVALLECAEEIGL